MSSSARTFLSERDKDFLCFGSKCLWKSMKKNNVLKMQDIDSSKCGRDLSANKLCIYINLLIDFKAK
jgi:hypothetical protein